MDLIKHAVDLDELADLITDALADYGVEERGDLSYAEQAAVVEDEELRDILMAAETRWFELED
jgi:hypothetical protein